MRRRVNQVNHLLKAPGSHSQVMDGIGIITLEYIRLERNAPVKVLDAQPGNACPFTPLDAVVFPP